MGAYGSPQLPPLHPPDISSPRPRRRRTAAGVRVLHALRRPGIAILCILAALTIVGAMVQWNDHRTVQNITAVGR